MLRNIHTYTYKYISLIYATKVKFFRSTLIATAILN